MPDSCVSSVLIRKKRNTDKRFSVENAMPAAFFLFRPSIAVMLN